MNATHIQTRQLVPAEAALFREIRLEALRSNPEAYGSTFEVENAQPLTWFADQLGGSNIFGAFDNSELVGVAALFIREGAKKTHKSLLWGMYVRHGLRKTGVGRRLVATVIDFARQRVEIIQLAVVSDNEEAQRLYASLGFMEYGLEKNALKHDGHYFDEILMAKDLMRE